MEAEASDASSIMPMTLHEGIRPKVDFMRDAGYCPGLTEEYEMSVNPRLLIAAAGIMLVIVAGACDQVRERLGEEAPGEEAEAAAEAADDAEPTAESESMPTDFDDLSGSECLRFASELTRLVGRGAGGDFRASVENLRPFVEGAPAEARDDFERLIAAYSDAYEVMEAGGLSFSDPSSFQGEGAEVMAAADEIVNAPEVEAALHSVEVLLYQVCPDLATE
jgi:hypothetical protein